MTGTLAITYVWVQVGAGSSHERLQCECLGLFVDHVQHMICCVDALVCDVRPGLQQVGLGAEG